MKIKYISIILLLLFARGCDFYSTSLWFFQPGGMEDEMNPLTRYFNVGWNGLIAVNILVVIGISLLYYYYEFRYQPVSQFTNAARTRKEYASLLYFNTPNQFYKTMYGRPIHRKPFYAQTGYVLIRTIIFVSFLATIHNLCQYYNVWWYNIFRSIVIRPHYMIAGLSLLFLIFTYRLLLIKEFEKYKKSIHNPSVP